MRMRHGNGYIADITNPQLHELCAYTITINLSGITRYSASLGGITVLQHVWLVHELMAACGESEFIQWHGLHHDDEEGVYCSDIKAPVKAIIKDRTNILGLMERNCRSAIYAMHDKNGLTFNQTQTIHKYDLMSRRIECEHIMGIECDGDEPEIPDHIDVEALVMRAMSLAADDLAGARARLWS